MNISPELLAEEVVTTATQILQVRSFDEQQREYLCREINERMQLSLSQTEQIIDDIMHPSNRRLISPNEMQAYALRFLNTEKKLSKRHANFVARYGKEQTFHLLEILTGLICLQTDEEERRIHLTRIYQDASVIGIDPLLISAIFRKYGLNGQASSDIFPLEDLDYLLIGRDTACDLSFFDPLVESLHAELSKSEENGEVIWSVKRVSSSRPMWVDGKLQDNAKLEIGSQIVVGPYTLILEYVDSNQTYQLRILESRDLSALSVQSLKRKIGEVDLLTDLSFTIFSGEVIALIGPSGAGKTTLLNAINGVAPADTGAVTFNGHNFHKLLVDDKSLVGIVPQDDLVLPELTVEESLFYSGKLRLHPSTSDEEIWKQVDRVLQELDILHIRKSRIGDALRRGISGGQRKRVNLGQELISSTTQILFLDEPTSGLDPKASQEIVGLVRSLADKGRIVFLVTHDLTDQIIGQVDNLLVLVKGGDLAFFGQQKDALDFFGVESTDKIFQRFGEEQKTWPPKFRSHPSYGSRELATNEFELTSKRQMEKPEVANWFAIFFRQLSTMTERYAKVKLRDTTGVAVLALQPPFLALVMTIVFINETEVDGTTILECIPTQTMIFMLSLSCLWFGMSAAVRELIADQVIFRRERRVGVRVLPYVLSKVIVLGVITALQACVLSGLIYAVFDMGHEKYSFDFLSLMTISCLTAWIGMSLGLLISSIWRSSEAAVGTLPLILIPQIAFSSIMFSIRDMQPLAKLATWLTFQRYTFDAFMKTGENIATRTRRGDFEPLPSTGTLWKLGLKMSDKADDVGFFFSELCLILSSMTIFMLIICVFRIHQRDKDS